MGQKNERRESILMPLKETKVNLKFFTQLERDILNLFAEGYKNKEIAEELSISEKNLKEIQVNLMRKWNVHTLSSAIDYALGSGLMTVYEVLESRFRKRKLEVN
jgi:DNA-binding NarL/FixJ family response regulator